VPLLNATGIAVIAVALGRKKVLGNGAIGCSPTSMPTSLISDGWPIGDPFGKDSSRTLLTGAEIGANTCTSVTCRYAQMLQTSSPLCTNRVLTF
jgi:hypothetical protein